MDQLIEVEVSSYRVVFWQSANVVLTHEVLLSHLKEIELYQKHMQCSFLLECMVQNQYFLTSFDPNSKTLRFADRNLSKELALKKAYEITKDI